MDTKVSFTTAKPETVGLSATRLGRLDRLMDAYVDDGRLAGYQAMIARKGKIVHHRAYGEAEVESGKPMTADTIVRAYSMSKPITAVATMIAYEEGLFRLDEPAAKYMPALSDLKVFAGLDDKKEPVLEDLKRPITIRHLLTHTAGLSYHFLPPAPVAKLYMKHGIVAGSRRTGVDPLTGFSFEDSARDLEDMVERLGHVPLIAQPGTRWHYSVGMDVLGRLIEIVSGQTFDVFLKERIFDPLGMTDTGFVVPDAKVDRLAACYGALLADEDKPVAEGKKFKLIDGVDESGYRKHPGVFSGGGGLVTTIGDYMRFGLMVVNSGELDGVRLISRKTADLMMSNHLPADAGPRPLGELGGMLFPNGGRGLGFGFCGAVVENVAETTLPVSKGIYTWGGAASTYFWADRKEDLVGIYLTQLVPSATYPLRPEMLLLTYQAIVD